MFYTLLNNSYQHKSQRCFISTKLIFVIGIFLLLFNKAYTQDTIIFRDPDITVISDSIGRPEAHPVSSDTMPPHPKKPRKSPLETEVLYHSKDSFRISIAEQKIYLFGEAQVNYDDIELKADYIVFDMSNNIVMATSLTDSLGKPVGKPVFKQGKETFQSDTLIYNFQTRKGIIKYIVTQQGEGYLHSKQTKRLADGRINLKDGKYTTCNAEHPHFYIGLTKAIAIPNEKIVSGPAYLVLEDVPLPLILPFGFFPNTTERSSGLIIPTYGNEQSRGLYLRNGGWYFAINDYFDLNILGDIYSRGTWGLSASSKYIKRYKFTGNFSSRFYVNKISNENPDPPKSTDFSIRWSHSQSPKANPTRSFSANVNFSSNSYDKNHSYDMSNYIQNTKSSSITFSKRWPGTPFNLAASLNHSQNSIKRSVDLNLPKVTFNMSRIYPFRGKTSGGKFKWYENIQVSYSANLENRINAYDSTLFTEATLKSMKNGFKHSIPVSLANFKVLNFLNITPSLSYNGVLYSSQIHKSYPDTSVFYNEGVSGLIIDTIRGLKYAHSVVPGISFSVNPKVYGMIESANTESYFVAIRHVMTPSASFSFTPDMSGVMPDYYKTINYPRSVTLPYEEHEYSIFQNYLYGTPVETGKSGSVSLGLSNNLELKVRPRNDTTGALKKIKLIDNLNFNSNYNPFKDEFRWAYINVTGSTNMFENKINLRFNSSFSPYELDSLGKEMNKYMLLESKKLARHVRTNINVGMSFRSAAADKNDKSKQGEVKEEVPEERSPVYYDETQGYYYGDYVDFSIPWSLRIDYNWSIAKPGLPVTKRVVQTIRVSGDFSLTKKLKIGGNTGYDLEKREVTVSNINIHRDLHCWEMRFSVVPFGPHKHYSFTINAKSTILRDLKYDKRKSWYDYL
jgi:lipopolysaccharide assembly outer membrane protein LptD (OstA)